MSLTREYQARGGGGQRHTSALLLCAMQVPLAAVCRMKTSPQHKKSKKVRFEHVHSLLSNNSTCSPNCPHQHTEQHLESAGKLSKGPRTKPARQLLGRHGTSVVLGWFDTARSFALVFSFLCLLVKLHPLQSSTSSLMFRAFWPGRAHRDFTLCKTSLPPSFRSRRSCG